MVDNAYLEVEGGLGDQPPYHSAAFLVLEGDFVDECERYVNDEASDRLSLRIDRSVAEKLYTSLSEILFGS